MGKRERVSEAAVKQASARGSVTFIRDDKLIGFALRVTPGGAKSFIVEARVNGRMRRFTIGPVSRYTVDVARVRARALLKDMHDGKDPQKGKRAARQRSPTLGTMLADYIEARGVKTTTAGKYHAQMRRHLSDWLEKPLAEITPQMVRLRYEATLRKSASEANGVMRTLRAVCRRAVKVLPDREDGTPAMKVIPTESLRGSWRALPRKTSLLEATELPSWWAAVAAIKSDASRRALHSLLLTGLRVNELLHLRWEDVDLAKRKIMIRDSKTGSFEKFVGPGLGRLLAEWQGGSSSERVFPVDDLRTALDRVVTLGGKRVTPHDLRRTFLTFGERVGAPIVTLKMLANHSTKGDVTFGYIRPSDDDLRHWAEVIERSIIVAARGGAGLKLCGSAPQGGHRESARALHDRREGEEARSADRRSGPTNNKRK